MDIQVKLIITLSFLITLYNSEQFNDENCIEKCAKKVTYCLWENMDMDKHKYIYISNFLNCMNTQIYKTGKNKVGFDCLKKTFGPCRECVDNEKFSKMLDCIINVFNHNETGIVVNENRDRIIIDYE